MASEFLIGESDFFAAHLTPGGRTPAVLPHKIPKKTRPIRNQRLTFILTCRRDAFVRLYVPIALFREDFFRAVLPALSSSSGFRITVAVILACSAERQNARARSAEQQHALARDRVPLIAKIGYEIL